jgi:hypothetical protein
VDLFVANEVTESWVSENIPDDDLLYMRVHKNLFDQTGVIFPGAFKNRPTSNDGMSTDWAKYTHPEETRSRGRSPEDNAIIQMLVRKVRLIPGQKVAHTPDLVTPNRAHSDVFGEKTTEARLKFSRIFEIVIPFSRV